MYKLVIVDDEAATRHGLRDNIPWHEYDIMFAGEADDGATGYELVRETKPDLLITDVKMRTMSGIELSLKLRSFMPNLKIIFISGYDDVDYIKSAMKLDAVDYILKPINLSELDAVIQKVVGAMREKRTQDEFILALQVKLRESMPLLRERFLLALMREGVPPELDTPDKLRARLSFLELRLPDGRRYCALAVVIGDSSGSTANTEEKRQLRSYGIAETLAEIVGNECGGYAVQYRQNEYACLIALDMYTEEKLYSLVVAIREAIALHFECDVTIGLGNAVDSLGCVHESFALAYYASSQKLYLGKNRVLTMDGLATDARMDLIRYAEDEKLSFAIRRAERDKVGAYVEEYLTRVGFGRGGMRHLQNACKYVLLMVEQILIEYEIEDIHLETLRERFWQEVSAAKTMAALMSILIPYILSACDQITAKRFVRSSGLVKRIKTYIEAHFETNLTIKEIAENVFFTSTHICVQFKQETGMTINDYVTQCRMQKAKELLSGTDMRTYDVCHAVGYSDPSYFSKLFKKVTGLTPSEYKEAKS